MIFVAFKKKNGILKVVINIEIMFKYNRKQFFLTATTLFLVVFLFSDYVFGNKWSLFIYPNGDTSQEAIKSIDAYKSLKECEEGFEFSKRSFPNAKFECGYKCKIQDTELKLYICEKTID